MPKIEVFDNDEIDGLFESIIRVSFEKGDVRVCDWCNTTLVNSQGIILEDCCLIRHKCECGCNESGKELVCKIHKKQFIESQPIKYYKKGNNVTSESWYTE